jgi:hypothetical protein
MGGQRNAPQRRGSGGSEDILEPYQAIGRRGRQSPIARCRTHGPQSPDLRVESARLRAPPARGRSRRRVCRPAHRSICSSQRPSAYSSSQARTRATSVAESRSIAAVISSTVLIGTSRPAGERFLGHGITRSPPQQLKVVGERNRRASERTVNHRTAFRHLADPNNTHRRPRTFKHLIE